ncbi:vacuolar fusion protein CCZ1 isoform X1 [Oratosquilla oratoria]|uniref:vacuolar fusion protein CCZ1 isoform X1 n=1 Tax=Oratosquilla oratoria TaxID=337810 RepID=UPI003F76D16B
MAAESSSQPYLKNFFIFNSSYGQKEGQEHEKVLYYHPSSTELDTQVRQVGLAEAITRFASQFNKTEDCESLHTQKTRQVFYQPEQNIWMVMTIGVGWISRERDMGLVKEYQGEEVQDVVYQSHLKHAYRAFTLLHSSFAAALSSGGVQGLKATLNSFFSTYLTSVNVSQGDILDVWSGVSFLPLDKQTFLRVHCCLSLLQATVPAIAHTAFLFNTNIVWCGLCAEDLRSLSHYLKTQILCGHSGVGPPESPTTTSYLTRFVGSGTTPSLLIYVRGETDSLEPHHLLLYTLQGATVCLTISASYTLQESLFEKIDRILQSKISSLASDIQEQLSKKTSGNSSSSLSLSTDSASSAPFRYVYHNRMNLATKTTAHGPSSTIPPAVFKMMVDMNQEMRRCGGTEMVVKTLQDHWIVGRSCDGREFFVVVNHRNANIVEVTDEVNRMCANHFSNIFMVE